MKKMFFGALLAFCSIIEINVFVILSVIHPWDYNGITGLRGYLIGSGTTTIFALFCITFIIGMVICYNEAYKRK